jgi:rod shape determining protein RodA
MIPWKLMARLLLRMNWVVTTAVLGLLTIGILFIYSATSVTDSLVAQKLWKWQVVWAVAGLGCYFGFTLIDYRSLRKFAWGVYAGSIILLCVVLVVGHKIYGARRWLDLFGFNLQPSELAKMGLIFILSRKLSRPGENLGQLFPLGSTLLIAAVPFFLILKEPDLGTAMILMLAAGLMLFVAGLPMRTLAMLAAAMLLVAGAVLGAVLLPEKAGMSEAQQEKALRMVGLNPYQKSRIEVFLGINRDPFGTGWNKRQSEISIGSGGLKGKGFQKGTQNILGYLPRSVAPTDFIFAVIAEETGFAGSAVVLTLFGLVIAGSVLAALRAHDKLGRLLCIGIISMFGCHVVINMAMTVGLMPITGLPLPLLSYGGSFMLITMASLGIVQSVYVRSHERTAAFEQVGLWQAA